MDLLMTAVVDITTLVATCHALKATPAAGDFAPQRKQRKQRKQLCRDLERATVAYIDALARGACGAVDDTLLAECRMAAESKMPQALAHQALLGRILASEAGSLDGLAAARQDLWRLAHVAGHLNTGMAALRGSLEPDDAESAEDRAGRLHRRLRKALVAYARAALRAKAPRGRLIVKARAAALAEIGTRGATQAEQLAEVEAGADPWFTLIRQGVTKPLLDLALDWQRLDAPDRQNTC